jgi:hypothetical protein
MATAALERPAPVAPAYLADVDPATWKWGPYLRRYSRRELKRPERRRLLTRYDPLLFAVLYLRHHLSSEETRGQISISQFHIDACREARTWCRKDIGPTEVRDAWVAPRGSGKSTWFFLLLSLWALAHEHRKFIAAFADSGPQAEQHLMSFKQEIDNNVLLRADYPDLVRPSTRPSGVNVSDMKSLYVAASGIAFLAKGIDSSTLGAKVGKQRPDLILFDDIEPDESNYSLYQKKKRLGTVLNAVLPMNLNAVVVFVGTTTMQGSIMHDIVRQVDEAEPPEWVKEENVDVHYYPAIVTNPDGTERSLWPQRWTMKFLDSIRHTVSFALNFANKPVSLGGWWKRSYIQYGALKSYDRVAMVIDGAVTTAEGSDLTGIAIAGLSVKARRLFIREAVGVKLGGEALRERVLELIVANDVDYVLVEANQGGDLWHSVFHDMPVPVSTFKQHEPKPVRIKRLLGLYQRAGSRIFHEKRLAELETQQEGYPKILHEDVLDAAAAVCEHLVAMLFRLIGTKDKTLVHQFSYRQGR